METERQKNVRRIKELLDAEPHEPDVVVDLTVKRKERATRAGEKAQRRPQVGRPNPRPSREEE